MKNLLIFTAIILLLSCNTKTPQEMGEEAFQKQMQKMDNDMKAAKNEVDSLYRIAAGHDPSCSKLRRMMACNELEEKYPKLNIDWDELRKAIRHDEFFKLKKRDEQERNQ